MNQVYFEGNYIDLYVEDYEYLQENLHNEYLKTINMMIEGGVGSYIVSNFTLEVSTTDDTKLFVSQGNGLGVILAKSGLIIQSSTGIDLIELSSSSTGIVNNVYCRCYQAYASYDMKVGAIIEARRTVDLSDHTLVYNRQIDKFSIVVYTNAEYAALTQSEKDELVFLGSTIAQGAGQPLVSIDITQVSYITARINNYSITFEKFDPAIVFPQRMVEPTSTGLIDDYYYNIPAAVNIQDNLNEIRTMIRDIKVSEHWDDSDFILRGSIPEINTLWKQGVFPNYVSSASGSYTITATNPSGSITTVITIIINFSTPYEGVISSTGLVVINQGSALVYDNVKPIEHVTNIILDDNIEYVVGNYATSTGEIHTNIGDIPSSFYLNFDGKSTPPKRNFILSDLYIVDAAIMTNDYTRATDPANPENGDDYYYDEDTGLITTLHTGALQNVSVKCFYKYKIPKIETVQLNAYDIGISSGLASIRPEPRTVTSTGVLILAEITKPGLPSLPKITTVPASLYRSELREIREILSTDLANFDDSGVFREFPYYTVHKLAVIQSSTGLVTSSGIVWAITTKGTYDNVFTLTSAGIIQLIINAQEDDELWIETFTDNSTDSILKVEYTSTGAVFYTEYVTIPASSNLDYKPVLNLLHKGFERGYHKVRISCPASDFDFRKLIIGKLDLYYDTQSYYTDKTQSINIQTVDIHVNTTLTTSTGNLALVNANLLDNAHLSIDDTFSTNSDYLIPSEKATNTWATNYILTHITYARTAYSTDYITFPVTGAAAVPGTRFVVLTITNPNLEITQDCWSVTGSLSAIKASAAGAGIQNAGLSFGGQNPTVIATTEKFNNTTWSASTALSSSRYGLMGCGIQNAALVAFGYTPGYLNTTDTFNGNTWANVAAAVGTARMALGGCGIQNAALSFGGNSTSNDTKVLTEKFDGSTWSTHSDWHLNKDRIRLAGCGIQNATVSFGGYTNSYSPVTEKFNGSVWSDTGYLNIARTRISGSGVQNAALSFGGTVHVTYSTATEKFNGSTWFVTGNLITARENLSGCGVQNAALSFGGYNSSYLASSEKFIGTIRFNYVVQAVSDPGVSPSTNITNYVTDSSASIIVNTPAIFDAWLVPVLWGDQLEKEWLKELNLDTFMEGIWSSGSWDLNTPQVYLAGAGIQNAALSFGGSNLSSNFSFITEKFNISTWTVSGNLNTGRNSLAGCGLQNAALSFGGVNAAVARSAITEKFNINTWTVSGNLNTGRSSLAGCGIQGAALSFGGNSSISTCGVTEIFLGSLWTVVGSLNTSRGSLAGCGLQNAALSFGGSTGSRSAVTEKFDGVTWTVSSNLNTARTGLAGAGIQSAALSFGGTSTGIVNITESFNGVFWTNITATPLITARESLAGCGVQGSALGFGGVDVSSSIGTTEKYNYKVSSVLPAGTRFIVDKRT